MFAKRLNNQYGGYFMADKKEKAKKAAETVGNGAKNATNKAKGAAKAVGG